MSDLITDAMVETAAQALHDHRSMECRALHEVGQPLGDSVYDNERRADARVALEAAAPLIAAKALRDAAEELAQQGVEPWDRNSGAIRTLTFLADRIERGES